MEELFWDALPQYLAIGMSAEEFWHGPFDLAVAYRKAWEIGRDVRYADEWRAGVYVKEALSVVLDHAFNKHATSEYPDAPLFSSEEERRAIAEERERRAAIRTRERLKAFADAFNKRFAERQGSRGGHAGEVPPDLNGKAEGEGGNGGGHDRQARDRGQR